VSTVRAFLHNRSDKSDLRRRDQEILRLANSEALCFYVFMRTTIDLPDELFRRAKAAAAVQGIKLREFVTTALERALQQGSNSGSRKRVKLPLIKGNGSSRVNPSREQLDASLWD
jgi:hypothetical protein